MSTTLFEKSKEDVLKYFEHSGWSNFLRLVESDEIIVKRIKGMPVIACFAADLDSFLTGGLQRLEVVCYVERGGVKFDLRAYTNCEMTPRIKRYVKISDIVRWIKRCNARIPDAIEAIYNAMK